MEPRVEEVDLHLVGVQGIIREDQDFTAELDLLWQRLIQRIESIPDVIQPARAIGYWHFVDSNTRLYFAGVQVSSIERFEWDHAYGLVGWVPGNVIVAVFEEENGEEGTLASSGAHYRQIAAMGLHYDHSFIGDFEVQPLAWLREGICPIGHTHEIWIPVFAPEAL